MSVEGPEFLYEHIVDACLKKFFPSRNITSDNVRIIDGKSIISRSEDINPKKTTYGIYVEVQSVSHRYRYPHVIA